MPDISGLCSTKVSSFFKKNEINLGTLFKETTKLSRFDQLSAIINKEESEFVEKLLT